MALRPPDELVVFSDAAVLAAAAAEDLWRAAARAILARGRFLLALAGGSTPEKLYSLLANPAVQARLDWSRTWVAFGDERFVPHTDPRSNFQMAWESLLRHVPLPAGQLLPIPTDLASPRASAEAYGSRLANSLGTSTDGMPPRFDVILLGLGDDGHTASLFPGAQALQDTGTWATWSPPGVLPPPVDRVTLTYPVLNAAREVWFLVAGANKAAPLRDVLEGSPSPSQRPAAGVRPTEGIVRWLVDAAAATQLGQPLASR